MAPPYHNLPPSPLHEDDDHHHLFHLKPPQTCSSNYLSLSSPIFINPQANHHDHQPEFYHTGSQPFQLHDQLDQGDKMFPRGGGSCDQYRAPESKSEINIWNSNDDINANGNEGEMNNSAKWMSSKMRMMRKMMNNPDQASTDSPLDITRKVDDHIGTESSCNINSSNNYSSSTTIRVCADCNTTKTPLWRSGPRGPKSLCNACGIRQRKARRAMAAAATAAATAGSGTCSVEKACKKSNNRGPNKLKDKKSRNMGCGPQFTKRCKQQLITTCPKVPNNKLGRKTKKKKQLCFEDLAIGLSKNSAFQRVFPQDEKEAAILLMALSYGLVHG